MALDELLDLLVPLHERDVEQVDAEQGERLVPVNAVVTEEDDERDQTNGVEGAVSEERPPRQGEHRPAEDGAHADHKKDVEHSRADDGADADVVERHEHAYHAGEELGGGAAGGHEGGAGHVVRNVQFLDDDVEGRHKELVAHDGQRDEHVDDAEDVQRDGALPPLLHGEEIGGEQRVLEHLNHRVVQRHARVLQQHVVVVMQLLAAVQQVPRRPLVVLRGRRPHVAGGPRLDQQNYAGHHQGGNQSHFLHRQLRTESNKWGFC